MNYKKLFFKTLSVAMILTILSSTLLQTNAFAATNGESQQVETQEVETQEFVLDPNTTPISEDMIAEVKGVKTRGMIEGIVIGFVGYAMAQTIMSNIINNGINATCEKYKNVKGMKSACKLISNKG